MGKLRHIAFIVEDPETSAVFFEKAFGMARVGSGERVCRLSDGVISIALMQKDTDEEQVGIDHFGIWVDDLEAGAQLVSDAGAKTLRYQAPQPDVFYEAKFETPDGITFDLSHTGWPGAVKDPEEGRD